MGNACCSAVPPQNVDVEEDGSLEEPSVRPRQLDSPATTETKSPESPVKVRVRDNTFCKAENQDLRSKLLNKGFRFDVYIKYRLLTLFDENSIENSYNSDLIDGLPRELVFDDVSHRMLTDYKIGQQDMKKRGVMFFRKISSERPQKTDDPAIYLVKSLTDAVLAAIKRDFDDGIYPKARVITTTYRASDEQRKGLVDRALSPMKSWLTLETVYLQFERVEGCSGNIFSLNHQNSLVRYYHPESTTNTFAVQDLKLTALKLVDMLSGAYIYPLIRYQKDSMWALQLSHMVHAELQKRAKDPKYFSGAGQTMIPHTSRPTLLILDRKLDGIAPLTMDFSCLGLLMHMMHDEAKQRSAELKKVEGHHIWENMKYLYVPEASTQCEGKLKELMAKHETVVNYEQKTEEEKNETWSGRMTKEKANEMRTVTKSLKHYFSEKDKFMGNLELLGKTIKKASQESVMAVGRWQQDFINHVLTKKDLKIPKDMFADMQKMNTDCEIKQAQKLLLLTLVAASKRRSNRTVDLIDSYIDLGIKKGEKIGLTLNGARRLGEVCNMNYYGQQFTGEGQEVWNRFFPKLCSVLKFLSNDQLSEEQFPKLEKIKLLDELDGGVSRRQRLRAKSKIRNKDRRVMVFMNGPLSWPEVSRAQLVADELQMDLTMGAHSVYRFGDFLDELKVLGTDDHELLDLPMRTVSESCFPVEDECLQSM